MNERCIVSNYWFKNTLRLVTYGFTYLHVFLRRGYVVLILFGSNFTRQFALCLGRKELELLDECYSSAGFPDFT